MPIVLTVDEYETIRLLDKKGYSQEQENALLNIFCTATELDSANASAKMNT